MVDSLGVTDREPDGETVPNPGIVISLALVVCQVSSVAWPCCTTFGFAARLAVGAGGIGGVGGVALATFLLQAADEKTTARVASKANAFSFLCDTLVLLSLKKY